MGISPEAIDKLIEVGTEPQKLHEDAERVIYSHNGSRIEILKDLGKFVPGRNHKILTLEGYLDYLLSEHCHEDYGIVFIDGNMVIADLDYMGRKTTQRVTLPLMPSEEAQGLYFLTQPCGLDQDELQELLISKLDGCIDDRLLLQISNLRVDAIAKGDVRIDIMGQKSANSESRLRVTYTDPNKEGSTLQADLTNSWVWTGRLWECWPETSEVHLTMRIVHDGGLRFKFIPRRLDAVKREATLKLVAEVKSKLTGRFDVFEGTL